MNKDGDIRTTRMSNHKIRQIFKWLTIVLSSFAIVIISYALTLPANTLEHGTIKVECKQADQKTLSSSVQAAAGDEKEESYFAFVYDPTQIQLDLTFDENNEAIIQDNNLSTVTVHKETVITDTETNESKDVYYFILQKGNETDFSVNWVSLTDTLSDDPNIHFAFFLDRDRLA